MSTRSTTHAAEQRRREQANEQRRSEQAAATRRHRRRPLDWAVGITTVAVVIGVGLLTSRPAQSTDVHAAPPFTLADTTGQRVNLADYRGHNVLLYFSEGAGCQACLVQMAEMEKEHVQFAALNVSVLPIVMNTRDQITADMAANHVTTPLLLDDGTASTAYGTIARACTVDCPDTALS